jgi:hypothetical protein
MGAATLNLHKTFPHAEPIFNERFMKKVNIYELFKNSNVIVASRNFCTSADANLNVNSFIDDIRKCLTV